jgi:hypothetical protein
MEPLWSPVVATGGNRSQIALARKPRKQAKTVAVACDRLPGSFMGKEGSTVRVRRVLCKSPANRSLFDRDDLQKIQCAVRPGAVYGAFRSTTTGDNDHSGLNPAARRLRAPSGSLPSVKRARSRAGTTYVLNRGPQSWTSDGSSQVDGPFPRTRAWIERRAARGMLSCRPAHAAGRSEREPAGSRSSSAPTCRRKARICDRVSSSRDRVTAVRLAENGARKPPLGEHGVRREDVKRVPAKMLRNAFARRPVLAASRSPLPISPNGSLATDPAPSPGGSSPARKTTSMPARGRSDLSLRIADR